MVASTKTLVDQIREIDKLVSDGMDKLLQAKIGLRSLEDRLKEQSDEPRPPAGDQ
ncbi:MAG TPA: hypothetical protein VGN29_21550 [Solirubrobacteraceae bacterium]|nr:hypothetical protein [Solirubrobacteraceae bacterium]